MAEFRIVYRGGVSYTLRGKTWKKGRPETTSDRRLVDRLRNKPGFVITEVKKKEQPQKKPQSQEYVDEQQEAPVKKKKRGRR